MARKKKDVAEKKKKKSDFGAFLKKRAPIYLGITALFLVFVVPSLTAKSLDDTFPDLSEEEQVVVDTLMGYDGGDGDGTDGDGGNRGEDRRLVSGGRHI